jgi:hypothetical protein
MKYMCQTLFDITATGVTGHCKMTNLPFQDRAGQLIDNAETWNRSRNQQRNWETLTQILGLRTQLFGLTEPVRDITGTRWMFEFETESEGIYGSESDPVQILRQDSEAVPMLCGLDNLPELKPYLITSGPDQNIWFAPLTINN